MAIAPGQQINAALARVDSSAPLQAELATGPIRTQARLEASARKIKQANEAMAEYKQKQETKKLKNQTVAYLQTLNDKKDPATQQVLQGVGVNFEDNKEVGAFIDVMGGSKSTMDTILESINGTRYTKCIHRWHNSC
jgi:glucan-binding YG repeat protein